MRECVRRSGVRYLLGEALPIPYERSYIYLKGNVST